MELNLVTVPGQKMSVSVIEARDEVFGCAMKEDVIHQVVTAYLANARQGTKAQKTRAEVSGGGIKPWKQKGTGRARAGTIRSPIWRKGGVTFAAKPRDYAQKVNRKMYKVAMRSILSELIRKSGLLLVENFSVAMPKTKELLKKMHDLGLNDALIVTDKVDENLYLASRNLYHFAVSDVAGLNPLILLKFEKIMMTVAALKQLEEKLA